MIAAAFRIAVIQLARNPGRTALTSLGILIGVAAVISMLSIGQSATARVEGDLASLGNNMLFVAPGEGRGGSVAAPLREADAEAIAELGGIAEVAPLAQTMSTITYGEEDWKGGVSGSTRGYLHVLDWTVATGRTFNDAELLSGADVCMLAATPREELFGTSDPLGAQIRIGNMSCEVIGVLKGKGQSTFGQDQDAFVMMPLRTYQRRISGKRDVSTIFVSTTDDADTDRVKDDLEQLMRARRHVAAGAENDFHIRDLAELEEMLSGVSAVLTGFLAAVAAVSLLVGGIGIMNIMMVSVTERTREIGIRLAVGALARDVLLQFLVEAMVLSLVGGMAGIVLGIALSAAAASWLEAPLIIDPIVIAGAFAFSALIGVAFGFFPARRAARMKPIDALRHE